MNAFLTVIKLLGTILLFCVIFFTWFFTQCMAQGAAGKPNLTMTMYYMKETEACRDKDGNPKGYPAPCKDWSIEEINGIKKKSIQKIEEIHDVPPSEVKLSDKLFRLLESYDCINKNNVNKGRVIFLVFKFDPRQTGTISIDRKTEKSFTGDKIKNHHVEGKLDNQKHWIYHERADAYLPGYKINWVLKILKDGEPIIWEFNTERE